MAELEKTDPLASMLGDGYSKLDQAGKVAAAGSFLKSRDEADKAARGEAGKRAEGQIISEFGPSLYSKPIEEFKPSQETAAGFAALGSLLMVAGGLFGGSGRLSGIGAMNNIAGMIKGYQSGRKDLYEQERQQFEENMKVQERNRADIKEAFNLALKMAPTNLRGAEEFMNKVFMSKGMNIPHEMMKTSGFTHTAGVMLGAIDKADNITKQIADSLGYKGVTSRKDLEARIAAQAAGTAAQSAAKKEDVASQIQALDLQTKQQLLAREGKTPEQVKKAEMDQNWADSVYSDYQRTNKAPVLKTKEEQETYAFYHKNAPFKMEADKEDTKLKAVKGEIEYLKNYLTDDRINKLSDKNISSASNRIDAAEQLFQLSELIKDTPEAAGVLGKTLSFLDKVMPSRYQVSDSVEPANITALARDPSIFAGIPADKISRVQDIQKRVIDVINARALAASGGNKMLVTEFNSQKGVLNITGLSSQSAYDLYRDIGYDELQKLKKIGFKSEEITDLANQLQPLKPPSDNKDYVYQDGIKYLVKSRDAQGKVIEAVPVGPQ